MTDAADFARPEPPGPAKDGHEWFVEADDPAHWLPAFEDATCRSRVAGNPPHACGEPATVRVLRGVGRPIWWNLDPQHAEGRWVEDGRVVHWAQRDAGPSA